MGTAKHNPLAILRPDPMKTIVMLALVAIVLSGCGGPVPSGAASDEIDVSGEPVQSPFDADPISMEWKNGRLTLTPVAQYSISARVVSTERYYLSWRSDLSPVDLALAWGNLTKPAARKHISYSQSGRWYFYKYDSEFPYDAGYIASHSSNNHVIPADQNLLKAVKKVSTGDAVELDGYLVNVAGKVEGRDVFWNSSLSRTDSGEGSCEVYYVTKIRIGKEVYE